MDRPRRSVRQPVKAPQLVAPEPAPRVIKRKPTPEVDPDKLLKTLLESSKSDLVSLDMHDIINNNTWSMLSEDARTHLTTLLPPTAFTNYLSTLGSDHPSLEDQMDVDESSVVVSSEAELNLGTFNDPYFLAATRTFQDHLYLNWFSQAHIGKVKQFNEEIMAGTLAAPWKDEVWERENPIPTPSLSKDIQPTSSFSIPSLTARAGGASEIKLYMLAKNKIIRVGDVITYRRAFATSEVIEKDTIIQAIHPKTFALTMLTQPGTEKDLPSHLLSEEPSDPSQPTQTMKITSPTMLETCLLDLDGRMEKSRRPNGNAWKCFSVWRWRTGAEYNPYDIRGGRENHGTLFYLRGSFYHES